MVYRELKKENGYTIAEVLIALTIISIVLATAGSVFVFINKQMISWKENLDFYNNYQVVQNKLFNDVLRAEQLSASDTSFVFTDKAGLENMYRWGSGSLIYNEKGVQVSLTDSVVIRFDDERVSKNSIQWSVYQVKDERQFHQNFVLEVRKPVLWEPLKQTGAGRF